MINNSLQTPHFIRCVRPNFDQIPGFFDENFVSDQLKSSGTTAYYELMQFGYPSKIQIDDLYDKLQPILKHHHNSIGSSLCCFIFLLASGFNAEDLKVGKSSINVRPGNSKLLEKLQIEINDLSPDLASKFDEEFLNHERRHKQKLLDEESLRLEKLDEGKIELAEKNSLDFEAKKSQEDMQCASQAKTTTELEQNFKPQEYGAKKYDLAATRLHDLDGNKSQKNMKCATQKKTQTEREQMPKNSVRFDGYKHYMNYDDPNEERKGYRCKLCGLQTNTYCIKCKVHLCFVKEKAKNGNPRKVRNCHMNFHELDEC